MSEQAGSSGRAGLGWTVVVLGVLIGFWLFSALPMSCTHTDISANGETVFTGTCTTAGGIEWSPEPPPDQAGRTAAADYCSTWTPIATVVASIVAVGGVVVGGLLITYRPRIDDPVAEESDEPADEEPVPA